MSFISVLCILVATDCRDSAVFANVLTRLSLIGRNVGITKALVAPLTVVVLKKSRFTVFEMLRRGRL